MATHGWKMILLLGFYLTSTITVGRCNYCFTTIHADFINWLIIASSACNSQNCSTYSSGCSTNMNCVCFQIANGTGLCATNLITYSSFGPCTGNLSCPGNDTICIINSCFGQPLCYPLSYAGPSVCPRKYCNNYLRLFCSNWLPLICDIYFIASNTPLPIVTVTQIVTQIQTVTQGKSPILICCFRKNLIG
jgi:hypothetical protein